MFDSQKLSANDEEDMEDFQDYDDEEHPDLTSKLDEFDDEDEEDEEEEIVVVAAVEVPPPAPAPAGPPPEAPAAEAPKKPAKKATQAAAKKAPAAKKAAVKAPAKPAAKAAPAKKAPAKKAAARKRRPKRLPPRRRPAKKAAAKKAPGQDSRQESAGQEGASQKSAGQEGAGQESRQEKGRKEVAAAYLFTTVRQRSNSSSNASAYSSADRLAGLPENPGRGVALPVACRHRNKLHQFQGDFVFGSRWRRWGRRGFLGFFGHVAGFPPGCDTTLGYSISMPLTACRHVRKMRGGAQSHLLEADDGNFYIVKFRNNPQHRRILVNELVSAVFLKYLQVSAAPAEFILHHARIPGRQPGDLHPSGHPAHPGRPRLALRFAAPRQSGRDGGIRLRSGRAAGRGQQPDRFPGRPGLRQVDGQRRRPPIRLLPRARRGLAGGGQEGVRGGHDRPRLRLQRPQLGVHRLAPAGPVSAQTGLRASALAGRFPALAGPGGAFSRKRSWTGPSARFPRSGWKAKKTNSSNCWKSCCAAARAFRT